MNLLHLLLLNFIFFNLLITFSSSAANPYLGIHPKDEKYYVGSEVIKCKDDESRYFTLDRLNDGFCDCVDGTDEPGTSACPNSKFYCRNFGSEPKSLFSSRVNDHLCDCCDGSDEYDGSVSCPNTCFKDGNVVNDNDSINSERASVSNTSLHNKNSTVSLEDLIHKAKDFRIIVIVEVVIVSSLVAFRLFCWRIKPRRRHNRLKGLPT